MGNSAVAVYSGRVRRILEGRVGMIWKGLDGFSRTDF